MLPSGTFPENYEQDKAIIRTRLQWGLFVSFLVLLGFVPVLVSDATLGILSLMGIFMVAVIGLQILVGYCGQINLGQSSFMGVGGLLGCLVAVRLNLPVEAALIIGGLAGAVYGLIFAVPAIRVKGYYLALTTMAAQLIFHFIFTRVPQEVYLGTYGGFPVTPPKLITGAQLTSPASMYYLILVVLAVLVFVATNITRSKLGRAFMAIRDNDVAAQVMGINIVLYKFLAFFICTFFAGIAGVLWGYYSRYVSVEQFTLVQSVFMLGMLIVGGLGSILGAILGTIFLRTLQEIVNAIGPTLALVVPQLGAGIIFALMNVMVGLIIILFLIFEPRGLAHRWRIFQRFYRLWPFPYS